MKRILAVLISVTLILSQTVFSGFAFGVAPNEKYADKTVVTISAKAQNTLTEKIHGSVETFNENTGEFGEFFAYDVFEVNPVITIEFDDGTKLQGTVAEIEEETGVFMYFSPVYCYGEAHTGVYTASVTYLDKTAEFQIEIVPLLPGDVNNDGTVSAIDARQILLIVAEVTEPTVPELAAADLDSSGTITAMDARWVLQIAAGVR